LENIKCNLLSAATGDLSAAAGRSLGRRWPVMVPWLIYGAVIFYCSSQSRFFLPPPEFFSSDKLYHFLEYLLLGILTVRVMRVYRFGPSRPVGLAALFCLLFGVSDEFHQWFVPGRCASYGDVLADALGGWTWAKLYAWAWLRPGWKRFTADSILAILNILSWRAPYHD
jgi:hypothetical protein